MWGHDMYVSRIKKNYYTVDMRTLSKAYIYTCQKKKRNFTVFIFCHFLGFEKSDIL